MRLRPANTLQWVDQHVDQPSWTIVRDEATGRETRKLVYRKPYIQVLGALDSGSLLALNSPEFTSPLVGQAPAPRIPASHSISDSGSLIPPSSSSSSDGSDSSPSSVSSSDSSSGESSPSSESSTSPSSSSDSSSDSSQSSSPSSSSSDYYGGFSGGSNPSSPVSSQFSSETSSIVSSQSSSSEASSSSIVSSSSSSSSGGGGLNCCTVVFCDKPPYYFPFTPQVGDRAILAPEDWRRIPFAPGNPQPMLIDFGILLPQGDF